MAAASDANTSRDVLLRFACACASATPVADNPWVPIAKAGKLYDGTKEHIPNPLYDAPHTINQLARELGLAVPSAHRQVAELRASYLFREVGVTAADRRSPVERYYRPSLPVVRAADRGALEPLIAALAEEIASVTRARLPALLAALEGTASTVEDSDDAETLPHYLCATAVRRARERLEAAGAPPPSPRHPPDARPHHALPSLVSSGRHKWRRRCVR